MSGTLMTSQEAREDNDDEEDYVMRKTNGKKSIKASPFLRSKLK